MWMFSSSESRGYSNADGLKYTSRCNRLLGLQEFQVTRTATHKHTCTCAQTHTHTRSERDGGRHRASTIASKVCCRYRNISAHVMMLPAHSVISIPQGVLTFANFGALISWSEPRCSAISTNSTRVASSLPLSFMHKIRLFSWKPNQFIQGTSLRWYIIMNKWF